MVVEAGFSVGGPGGGFGGAREIPPGNCSGTGSFFRSVCVSRSVV